MVNNQGELVAERLQRGDGNMEASLATDRGQPTNLSASRKERVDGFEEEVQAAESLATAYNAHNGTSYTVRPKPEEDNDYVDRYLDSKIDEPRELGVQIRHLDTDVIARLGKQDEFDVKRTAGDLITSINKAITAKAAVDPKLKPKTILLLQLPVMLGKIAREEIQRLSFDLNGFRGVWIAPFRDECFEVLGPAPGSETMRPEAEAMLRFTLQHRRRIYDKRLPASWPATLWPTGIGLIILRTR